MSLSALAPAFAGLPGGVELFVILLIAVIMFGIPALVVLVGGGYLLTRSASQGGDGEADEREDDDRIAELEAKVDDLQAELEAERESGERETGRTRREG
ncbi:hypothetical protein [Halocalculus aciditolerans]|uniref:Sec-independent protein translocase protein TatA n=1 Tax=Halocalculus aciditolerans TaxID=1383812 RepID=A0A830FFM1_9EURY|nr:hypothetical protein [Halocalculus aciditolerans]GGL70748.1 hypothetical protein GCM10009039_31000 [Halocalculus aciditolerans]